MSVLKHRNPATGEWEPIGMPLANMLPPVKIAMSKIFETATTASAVYTGVSFTVPANSLVNVVAGAQWSSAAPLVVGLSTSPTTNTGEAASVVSKSGNYAYMAKSVCPMSRYVTEDTTFYVWAQVESAGKITVFANGYYMTVPETVAEMSGIEDITDKFITLPEGKTLHATSAIYKQGKHIFGNVVIETTNAVSTTSEDLGTLSFPSNLKPINSFAVFGGTVWKSEAIGYLYAQGGGAIACSAPSGSTYKAIKFSVDYVCA